MEDKTYEEQFVELHKDAIGYIRELDLNTEELKRLKDLINDMYSVGLDAISEAGHDGYEQGYEGYDRS